VVDVQNMQVEVPLHELMPDLGQDEVRREIAELRRQILEQARQGEQAQAEARHLQEEYQRSLEQQKQRGRQFDTWLSAVGRLRVGQEVPIARKPGRAEVVKVDLPGLRATVRTDEGEMELSIQELFPQTGPFARRPARPARPRKLRKPEDKGDRPLRRRSADSRAAQRNLQALLAVEPGEQVYVVPFHKRATVIRINPDKQHAVVQSGIFEMEIPLADLEPLRDSK